MTWLAVFAITAVIDIVWTRCVQYTAQKKPVPAAGTASLLVLLGAFNTLAVVDDPRMVIPAALGAFVGTWWACR